MLSKVRDLVPDIETKAPPTNTFDFSLGRMKCDKISVLEFRRLSRGAR